MGWRDVLIVLAAFSSLLRGELLPVKTYTTADGLAANRINSIASDSRGFLWFCTQEGLSRFDGHPMARRRQAYGETLKTTDSE